MTPITIRGGGRMATLGVPIAVGRTAEVFAWGEGRILKLYRPQLPEALGLAEIAAAGALADAGLTDAGLTDARLTDARLTVPRHLGTVRVDGRLGLVYERVQGRSMLEDVAGVPWLLDRLARRFAEVHAVVHASSGAGLRDATGVLEAMIERAADVSAGLPADLRAAALDRLRRLPAGAAVLHGDLHPGNVLMGPSGPTVIDWMTATCGNPAADVARTLYLLREAADVVREAAGPGGTTGPGGAGRLRVTRLRVTAGTLVRRLVRRRFAGVYLRRYLRLRPLDRAELRAWRPVVLAARLGEQIDGERDHLLAGLRASL